MEIEYLTDELRTLISWGAKPRRLPGLPTFRSLVNIPEGTSFEMVGYLMLSYLITTISRLDGEYPFEDSHHSDHLMKRVYRLLFKLEGVNLNAPNRRDRVMQLLGTYHPMDQWRRRDSSERDLVRILAESMWLQEHPESKTA